jgi:UDP-GlcNAc:undecaprenyl-phosphate GlcNAc-1-phosphate transferase
MLSLNLLLAGGVSAAVILLLAPWAHLVRLMDTPGGRRIHLHVTPRIGGIGILAGIVVGWSLIPESRLAPAIVFAAVFIALVGLVDDMTELSAGIKFTLQLTTAAVTIWTSGLVLPDLGGVLPGLRIELPWLGVPLALLAYGSLMNAINMVDGLDGLAGTVSLVSFIGLGLAASLGNAPEAAWMAFAPAAAIAGFLVLNARVLGRRHAFAFMGDAGSMLIGFLLATLGIVYTQAMGVVPPIVALWICALPLIDGLVVIVRRRLTGAPTTAPGCDHLHHLLHARGLGVNAIVAVEGAAALFCVAVGLGGWLAGAPEWVLAGLFVATTCGYAIWSKRAWRALRASGAALALDRDDTVAARVNP